jgi:membrane protein implicated in regulation of membrane protease activity
MFETIQSKLVFAFAMILLVLDVIGGYFMYGRTMGSIVLLIVVLLGIPLALLFAYDINCLVVGNCNLWSWIRSILYLLVVVLSIVVTVLSLVRKDKANEKKEKKEEKEEKEDEDD